MNKLNKERLDQAVTLCASTAVATAAFLGASEGKLIGWLVGIPFLLVILMQIWQMSQSDEYHLSRIKKDGQWLNRHPLITIIFAFGLLAMIIMDIIKYI